MSGTLSIYDQVVLTRSEGDKKLAWSNLEKQEEVDRMTQGRHPGSRFEPAKAPLSSLPQPDGAQGLTKQSTCLIFIILFQQHTAKHTLTKTCEHRPMSVGLPGTQCKTLTKRNNTSHRSSQEHLGKILSSAATWLQMAVWTYWDYCSTHSNRLMLGDAHEAFVCREKGCSCSKVATLFICQTSGSLVSLPYVSVFNVFSSDISHNSTILL